MNIKIPKLYKFYQGISQSWREFIRFCGVGFLATIIHYTIYLVTQRWIWIGLAYTIGYVMSLVTNYLLTNYITFKTKPSIRNGIGFCVSHIFNYSMHIGLLNLFLWIGLAKVWAPIPVYCIAIPINFLIIRFVFKIN